MNTALCSNGLLSALEAELRLRIRLELARTLSARGFWPTTSAYGQYMRARKRLGRKLQRSLLRTVLGDVDYRYLDTGRAFAADYRSRQDLPAVAAFGFELNRGLHRLLGGRRGDAERGARLCSLFNMGICLFDHIVDVKPQTLPKLAGFVDENAVAELLNDRSAPERLLKRCSTEPAIEVRILCKIIGAFFRGLHDLRRESGRPEVYSELGGHLLSSYRAEIASIDLADLPEPEQLELGRETFSLPLLTMLGITRLSPGVPRGSPGELQTAVTELGALFRLVDDLSDVLDDLEAGRANTIVGHVRARGGEGAPSEESALLLAELLAWDRIEAVTETLCEKMAGVLARFASASPDRHGQSLIRDFVIMHVRGWAG